MDLAEKIATYKQLIRQVGMLEEEKRKISQEIIAEMPDKRFETVEFRAIRYQRLSIRPSLELARQLDATRMEEQVDKEKINRMQWYRNRPRSGKWRAHRPLAQRRIVKTFSIFSIPILSGPLFRRRASLVPSRHSQTKRLGPCLGKAASVIVETPDALGTSPKNDRFYGRFFVFGGGWAHSELLIGSSCCL